MSAPQIHPSSVVGPRVKICANAIIGPNCRLDGDTTIGAGTRLVDSVTLCDDARIGKNCVLGSGVTLAACDARLNGSNGPLELGDRVQVGAGSVLRPSVRVGTNARIAADSTVSCAVPPHAIVSGNPAAVVGFATTAPIQRQTQAEDAVQQMATVAIGAVAGVKLFRFPHFSERRGVLSFAEVGSHIPFEVSRYFLVYGVPVGETRGEHAHAECEELLVCVKGTVTVFVDDGSARQEFLLDQPNIGLYIPQCIWATQYKHSPDAVLMVLASHHYDAGDYITDYESFLAARQTVA